MEGSYWLSGIWKSGRTSHGVDCLASGKSSPCQLGSSLHLLGIDQPSDHSLERIGSQKNYIMRAFLPIVASRRKTLLEKKTQFFKLLKYRVYRVIIVSKPKISCNIVWTLKKDIAEGWFQLSIFSKFKKKCPNCQKLSCLWICNIVWTLKKDIAEGWIW